MKIKTKYQMSLLLKWSVKVLGEQIEEVNLQRKEPKEEIEDNLPSNSKLYHLRIIQ